MSQTVSGPIEYSQFLLHDGEDDKKTDDLHAFLHPLCNGETEHDFEGHNSGLYITLGVRPGDIIQLSKDGWVRILRKEFQ